MARLSRRFKGGTSLKTAAKEAKFEGNLLCFVRARAHVRALMTRKSCAVGMRNTILRNYLKK